MKIFPGTGVLECFEVSDAVGPRQYGLDLGLDVLAEVMAGSDAPVSRHQYVHRHESLSAGTAGL
jgi:hypothetical protein